MLGDLARRLPEPCGCGRSLPLLSDVEGRSTDWLRSASGRPIHPQTLRGILRAVEGVRRYQLVQERPGHVRVVAVAAPGADREEIRARVVGRGPAAPRTRSTPRSSSPRPCRGRRAARSARSCEHERSGKLTLTALRDGMLPQHRTGRRGRSRRSPTRCARRRSRSPRGGCTASTTSPKGLGDGDDRGLTPLAALEEAILPALRRPPCLVSFSGGRDSSCVLAAATRAARREGLQPPVPVTLRVSNAPSGGGIGMAGASRSPPRPA